MSFDRMTTLLSGKEFSPGSQQIVNTIRDEVRSCMDVIQTIISCALHQKRVIDDTLTLSKLDSNLIVITPIKSQPVVVVKEVINMFKVECRKEDIALRFHEDRSLGDLGADWVMIDPSRLHQVSWPCIVLYLWLC